MHGGRDDGVKEPPRTAGVAGAGREGKVEGGNREQLEVGKSLPAAGGGRKGVKIEPPAEENNGVRFSCAVTPLELAGRMEGPAVGSREAKKASATEGGGEAVAEWTVLTIGSHEGTARASRAAANAASRSQRKAASLARTRGGVGASSSLMSTRAQVRLREGIVDIDGPEYVFSHLQDDFHRGST
eukprot:4802397-Prymnesium_polylepis.1